MNKQVLYRNKNKTENLEIWASIDKGNLLIEGHDLGTDLPLMFGPDITEYEWSYTIQRKDFQKLIVAIGDENSVDVMNAFVKRFLGVNALGILSFLKENKIPFETWSRMGD